MSSPRPIYVALEGLDASGKTTQAKLLADAIGAVQYAFPVNATETGKLIRARLGLPSKPKTVAERREEALMLQALFAVNRTETARFIERDLFVRNKPVVVDRHFPSGVAYGGAQGLDKQWLIDINHGERVPDLFIFLNFTPEESFARKHGREDAFEQDFGLLKRAYDNYVDLFSDPPISMWGYSPVWKFVDANRTVEEVHKRILAHVTQVQTELTYIKR